MRARFALTYLVAAAIGSACGAPSGGANQGARAPGNGDSGIQLGSFRWELAVSPNGRFALYRHADQMLLLDLQSRVARAIPGLREPQLVAFWPDGTGFFCVAQVQDSDAGSERHVLSMDAGASRIVWSQPLAVPVAGMQMANDGSRLVLWGDDVLLLDPTSGALKATVRLAGRIVDVDTLGSARWLVLTEDPRPRRRASDASTTRSFGANPTTVIHVRNLLDGTERCAARVPNCADELVITRDGTRAFLAPTVCGKDPVTVVELATCNTLATLPGFGPVALVDEGKTAIAFLDQGAPTPGDPAPRPAPPKGERYRLSFIDTTSLRYETIPMGDGLPRYAAMPDNKSLVVDSALGLFQIRLLSLEQRSVQTVRGPAISLRSFVMTPDSAHLYALLNGLYDLDLAQRRIDSLPLDFLPVAINITPDGKSILLLDDQGRVHWLDPTTRSATAVVSPP